MLSIADLLPKAATLQKMMPGLVHPVRLCIDAADMPNTEGNKRQRICEGLADSLWVRSGSIVTPHSVADLLPKVAKLQEMMPGLVHPVRPSVPQAVRFAE